MTGTQALPMHDPNATQVAIQRLIDEIKQDLPRSLYTHVVQVDGVCHTEVAAAQPLEGSLLMAGPQE
jgi:hypothetical protein